MTLPKLSLNHRARFRATGEPRALARAEPRPSVKPAPCAARRLLAPGRLVVTLICAAATASSSAAGPEFSWVPVGATSLDGGTVLGYTGSGHNCPDEPTTIRLLAGYWYVVEFEVRMAGWGAAPGTPTLGTYQAGLDLSGLSGANADPPNPGVDLVLYEAAHGPLDGCFIAKKLCHESTTTGYLPCELDYCDVWGPGDPSCPGHNPRCDTCLDNPFFVFPAVLSTGPEVFFCCYWGETTNAGQCRTDEGCPSYYGGTFKLVAPNTATGTYTFGFDPASSSTFLNDCGGSPIPGLILTSGGVSLTGACCMPDGSCELHPEDECELSGGDYIGGLCAGDPDGDGVDTSCGDPCPLDNPDDTDGDGVCNSDDICPGLDDAVYGPECAAAIPAVSMWGVIILALLLAALAKTYFRHRRVGAE